MSYGINIKQTTFIIMTNKDDSKRKRKICGIQKYKMRTGLLWSIPAVPGKE